MNRAGVTSLKCEAIPAETMTYFEHLANEMQLIIRMGRCTSSERSAVVTEISEFLSGAQPTPSFLEALSELGVKREELCPKARTSIISAEWDRDHGITHSPVLKRLLGKKTRQFLN